MLRMLESYLGEETFRAGVNKLSLEKQRLRQCSQQADFWNSHDPGFKKASRQDHVDYFVEQPRGPPFVSVKTHCQGVASGDVELGAAAL